MQLCKHTHTPTHTNTFESERKKSITQKKLVADVFRNCLIRLTASSGLDHKNKYFANKNGEEDTPTLEIAK